MVDLFIFQNAKISGEALIHLGFDGEDGGKITSGIQKMAQTWTLLFLTELGSIQYDPTVGTDFVTNLRMGAIRDESDVQLEFGVAASSVYEQMNTAANVESMPPDELLQSSRLISFNLDRAKGLLSLYVGLTSQAGTTHDILLPIPVAIQ